MTSTGETSRLEDAAFSVNGMNCASCVAHVTKAMQTVPGVESCNVNLARGRATAQFDPHRTTPETIAAAVTDAGYPAAPESPGIAAGNVEEHRLHHQMEEARSWFLRAMVGIALWLPFELMHWISYLFAHHTDHDWMARLAIVPSTIAIIYLGKAFYVSAWRALRHGTSNMDTLIAMGASVAYVYSLVAFIGYQLGWWGTLPDLYFMESAGLLALISLGHWLEARARQSAGSAIRELLNLTPPAAFRLRHLAAGLGPPSSDRQSRSPLTLTLSPGYRGEGINAQWDKVPVADLHVGDRVLVRPGDRVPIDGLVIEGRSSVDESMISGEPLPVLRTIDDTVIGGTVNQDGRLIVRATKVGADTALAQIVKLVEHAQATKPPVQKLADQISAIFVPSVLVVALITGIGWYFWGLSHDWSSAQTWGTIARTVCSVLIIACPCALGLAVPAALMVGTGRGAKRGILIRDIDGLQNAEKIATVVLDKTGTITRGKPIVAKVESLNSMAEEEILRRAAAAEQFSEHPLAKAIVAHAQERGLKLADLGMFTNDPGYGIVAEVDGDKLLVGSESLLTKHDAALQSISAAHRTNETIVHIGVVRPNSVERLGVITITDEIKSDSQAAIEELHRLKLRTVLLTGDNRAAAEAIAKTVGIDDVRAEVKPDQKASAIQELQLHDQRVAMVGDGINDAPALAQADLGIAIGSGSDIAKETGDIVLVSGSLHGIATSIRLSRATMRTIRQNLFLAFIYNVLAIPLAALGFLNPLIAAAAMALSDVTVIGNALLLRRTKID